LLSSALRNRVTPARAGIAVVAGALAASSFTFVQPATGQSTPSQVPYAELYEPVGSPDRVTLNPTEDNRTTAAVSWRTSADVETPVAQVVEIEEGPGFKNYGNRSGRNEVRNVAGEWTGDVEHTLDYPSRYFTAVLDDLEPATTYLYRVGDGSNFNRSNWSEWFEFTTEGENEDEFSFIYMGDSQNDVKEHASRVFRQAFAARPDAEVMVNAGDLVDFADRDWEWGEWFHAMGYHPGSIRQISTPGNHEYFRQNAANNVLGATWDAQFNHPDNGPKPDDSVTDTTVWDLLDKGSVYYTDYKGVRFISLDTNGVQAFPASQNDRRIEWWQIQAEWLDEVLSDNPNQWTVITMHHPMFSVSTGRDNPHLRQYWLPVFERHDVDLVLQGHDHTYGRGHLASAQRNRTSPTHNGTVYTVSVSGPKMYNVSGAVWSNNDAVLRSTAQDTQLYQLIDVSSNELRYEAYNAAGEWHDGFTIRKTRNQKVVTELRR
jgi:hypothetical protein